MEMRKGDGSNDQKKTNSIECIPWKEENGMKKVDEKER